MNATSPYPVGTWSEPGRWPGSWIAVPGHATRPLVAAYRRQFTVSEAVTVDVLVSADERYELFLDGQRIGRGPGRGDARMWPVANHRLELSAGSHVLVARVWSLGGLAPVAQISVGHGFVLAAPGAFDSELATGLATWEGHVLTGWSFAGSGVTWGTGALATIDGTRRDWAVENGGGEGWLPVVTTKQAHSAITPRGWLPDFQVLTPAWLPPQRETPIPSGEVRHLEAITAADWGRDGQVIAAEADLPGERAVWQAWLDGTPLTLAAACCRRAILDLGVYRCAWPELTVSGGAGAAISVRWAESAYLASKGQAKGDRGALTGKYFFGPGEVFLPDGGGQRVFGPQWWRAGRYIEIQIRTGDAPVTLEALALVETCYPLTVDSGFACSDARLEQAAGPMLHTLRMCMHETYVDCPYYEQLMYVGDTRIEVLTTYALSGDDRLPRAALRLFDHSRRDSDLGLTTSRYPCRDPQMIPTFSLWWVAMVHDFAMWRDDPAFVRSLLPGARAVIDAVASWIGEDGVLHALPGWNFIDWTEAWRPWTLGEEACCGVPPDGHRGRSAILGWQFVYVLGLYAQLEELVGDPDRGVIIRRRATRLAEHTDALFWNEQRGLWSDAATGATYSEHAQCLALLSGYAPAAHAARAAEGLLNAPDLERTSIYFSHYLFETYRSLGAMPRMLGRMDLWFDLPRLGLTTTPEEPEPARSDCHAWGAHPLYHYRAGLLGIRPAAPGFREVLVEPQLGQLDWASGSVSHPHGLVAAEVRRHDGGLAWSVTLPAGVTGTLRLEGRTTPLQPGVNRGGWPG